MQGTSRERVYQELGLESYRRCYRKLIFFHKIVNGATPRYLTSHLNTNDNPVYNTTASDQNNIRRFRAKTEHFKQSFFPFCVSECYKLNSSLRVDLKFMFQEFFNLKQRSLFAIQVIIKAIVKIQSFKQT